MHVTRGLRVLQNVHTPYTACICFQKVVFLKLKLIDVLASTTGTAYVKDGSVTWPWKTRPPLEKAGCDSFELLLTKVSDRSREVSGLFKLVLSRQNVDYINTNIAGKYSRHSFDVEGRSRSLIVSNRCKSCASMSKQQQDSECLTFVGRPRYYRKRGSASYIVREVQSVRERESETEVVRRK